MESKDMTSKSHYDDAVLSSFKVLEVKIPTSRIFSKYFTTSDHDELCKKMTINLSYEMPGTIFDDMVFDVESLNLLDAFK
jgi:hypothetical protein